jgi:hypothetical protein
MDIEMSANYVHDESFLKNSQIIFNTEYLFDVPTPLTSGLYMVLVYSNDEIGIRDQVESKSITL